MEGLVKCKGKRGAGESPCIFKGAGRTVHGMFSPPSSSLSPFILIHKDLLETKNILLFPGYVPKVSF